MTNVKREPRLMESLFSNCSFGNLDEVESSEEDYDAAEDLLSIMTSTRSLTYPTRSPALKYETPLLPTQPSPLQPEYWTEPTASSFQVRGQNYLKDRKKIESQPSLFRLFAVDLVKVTGKPILQGFCNHPNERVQQCLRAEKANKPGSEMPPYIFCINITIPGKPAHHLVMYYAIDDISLIQPQEQKNGENLAPFHAIASKFFFGDSDKFRDSTFKLVPRIVKGNFVVKKAVGRKPTILGGKVKQHYIQNDRFFELIVDVGSDNIAKKVVGLCGGYVSRKRIWLVKWIYFSILMFSLVSAHHSHSFFDQFYNRRKHW